MAALVTQPSIIISLASDASMYCDICQSSQKYDQGVLTKFGAEAGGFTAKAFRPPHFLKCVLSEKDQDSLGI